MNKHTRWIVGILGLLLAALIIATISFSVNISKRSAASHTDSTVVKNSNGNEIIQGDNQLYGVSDSAGNIVLKPEWKQLSFLGTNYLVAQKGTSNGNCVGVLDLDGNVVTPFVYEEVQALTDSYYLAYFPDSKGIVLYDYDFCAMNTMLWDSCDWEELLLTLVKGEDTFQYTLETGTLQLEEMQLSRKSDSFSFTVNTEELNPEILKPEEWQYVTDMMLQTLEAVKSQSFSEIEILTDQEHENAVLNGISLTDVQLLRISSQVYLQAAKDDSAATLLTWQVNLVIRNAEQQNISKILTVTMQKNAKAVWMISGASLS